MEQDAACHDLSAGAFSSRLYLGAENLSWPCDWTHNWSLDSQMTFVQEFWFFFGCFVLFFQTDPPITDQPEPHFPTQRPQLSSKTTTSNSQSQALTLLLAILSVWSWSWCSSSPWRWIAGPMSSKRATVAAPAAYANITAARWSGSSCTWNVRSHLVETYLFFLFQLMFILY